MAQLEVIKKVNYVGTWLEDVFSDEVVHGIATYARGLKGKKRKVKLNRAGLRLTRTKLWQEIETDFYIIHIMKAAMKNPEFPYCVMFTVSDPEKKYRIIALRCATEADAVDLINVFNHITKDLRASDVELRKRDNGNWTLRERSAHNASRHLAEIFNESNQKANGDVTLEPNGNIHHVPVLDRSKVQTNGNNHTGTYIKKRSKNIHTHVGADENGNDDEYVIETEVTTSPYTYNDGSNNKTGKFRPDVSDDMREIKHKLEQASFNDQPDSARYSSRTYSSPSPLPSHPVVYTSTESHPVVYKTPPKAYEATMVTKPAGYYTNPWAGNRRSSGGYILPTKMSESDSRRNSLRVKFDTESLRSNTSKKSKSLRLRASEYSIPTTVQRSIEETYPRPVIIRRHSGNHHMMRKPRPHSYHVVGSHELRLYHTDRDMDIAL